MSEPPTMYLEIYPESHDIRKELPSALGLDDRRENCKDWGVLYEWENDPDHDYDEKVIFRLVNQKDGEQYYTLLGPPAKKAREEVCKNHGGKWDKDMEVNVYFRPGGDEIELRDATNEWF